ncbi:hypothetical protein HQ533_03095 [Candidatus Woesearchaeota archaeon]|nr:hypothetical protein [Candidatus Woesearchaeota archaeon]
MARINVSTFPRMLKSVHNAQKKWRQQNYENSITKFKDEIEKTLEILNFYGKWKSKFSGQKITDKMIPEIFMDGLSSLHFALWGQYKYANMGLRSQLETALRLIYFMDHPREYEWWLSGNEWYKGQKGAYVWGDDFNYFKQIDKINKFDKNLAGEKKIYSSSSSGKSGNLLKEIYGKLSKSIHTSAQHFQTSIGRFSPKYSMSKMETWLKSCKDLQCYIIVSLILSFPKEFKKMSSIERSTILTKGVVDSVYIKKINEVI